MSAKSKRGGAERADQRHAREGWGGRADNPLSILVKEGKVTRRKIVGERGSQYSLP